VNSIDNNRRRGNALAQPLLFSDSDPEVPGMPGAQPLGGPFAREQKLATSGAPAIVR
jgi:hypothetical protein